MPRVMIVDDHAAIRRGVRGQVLKVFKAPRIISDTLPQTKIVLLTLHSSTELVRSAFRAGARGYVLKSDAEQELIRALNVILGDGTYVSPTIDEDVAKRVVEEMGKRQ